MNVSKFVNYVIYQFVFNPFMTKADIIQKSMDWFLYDNRLLHERVKYFLKTNFVWANILFCTDKRIIQIIFTYHKQTSPSNLFIGPLSTFLNKCNTKISKNKFSLRNCSYCSISSVFVPHPMALQLTYQLVSQFAFSNRLTIL